MRNGCPNPNPNFKASCPEPNLTLNREKNRFRDALSEKQCWLGASQKYAQPARETGSKITKRSFSAHWAKTQVSAQWAPKIASRLKTEENTEK